MIGHEGRTLRILGPTPTGLDSSQLMVMEKVRSAEASTLSVTGTVKRAGRQLVGGDDYGAGRVDPDRELLGVTRSSRVPDLNGQGEHSDRRGLTGFTPRSTPPSGVDWITWTPPLPWSG
jgi:hypothetical protein